MKNLTTFLINLLSAIIITLGVILYLSSHFIGLPMLIVGIGFIYLIQYKNNKKKAIQSLKSLGKALFIPFIGLVVSLIIVSIILISTGYNPLMTLKTLIYGGFIKSWHSTVLNATPLIFTGLAIGFAFNAGLFNIGAQGQYYVGTAVATAIGIYLPMPSIILIVIAYVVSMLLSASYNIIPAYLKIKTGAHEVITTMMFAQIASSLSGWWVNLMGGEDPVHKYKTDKISTDAWLMKLKDLVPLDHINYRLNVGILVAILTAFVCYFILYKTTLGFKIRAVGHNKDGAKAQGIKVNKIIFVTLLISGALAGMSGVTQVLGLEHRMTYDLSSSYGWDGISVALLASGNPIGIIFSAFLWGGIDSGGQYLERVTDIHKSIVEIMKGLILFFVVARYIYLYINTKFGITKKLFKNISHSHTP